MTDYTQQDNRSRLKEITSVLRQHEIAKGLTPQKLRAILEDLGPTFIKLGQILSMRPDLIPRKYCSELQRLHSDVTPMPYYQMKRVMQASFMRPLSTIFSKIEAEPIGSASIAQVHAARLLTGEKVVVKVQREGIRDTMARDISLLHRAVRFIPPVSIKGLVDLDMILDELWSAAQEEMDFLKEASNMKEFSRLNRDVAFVVCPVLYEEFTTVQVLVMEYIDGFGVDEKDRLLKAGYDLREIGEKLADNYVRQIMQDGFFHADPHPGNLRIREGKIVFIDMGMMGRLSARDKSLIGKAVKGVARNNIGEIVDAVLMLGKCKEKPDRVRLYSDIEDLMEKYGTLDMGNIDVARLMLDLMDVMNANRIAMPPGLTMLARGMTTIEGVLADLSPDINMVEVASSRIAAAFLQNLDLKEELKNEGKLIYRSFHKALDVPVLLADLLRSYQNNETRIKLDLHATDDLTAMLDSLIKKLVMGLLISSLLIASSIICTTNMQPRILGIPALGVIGYILALILTITMLYNHIRSGRSGKKR